MVFFFFFNLAFAIEEVNLVDNRLAEVFPKEAINELKDHRTCVHFSGEEPYDEQRRQDIVANLKTHCRELKKIMAKFEKTYNGKAWLKEFPKVWNAIGENADEDDL